MPSLAKNISIANPTISASAIKSVITVLKTKQLARGKITAEIENRFAALYHTKFAVAVSSGTAGIHATLLALGIGPGDEVITTPFTFAATASSILLCGAKVVFADILPGPLTLDPQSVAKKITSKTKAVIGVDLYGQKCRYEQLKKILPKSVHIIEDSCQAIGSTRNSFPSGHYGTAAVFSFHPTKIMYSGEGGLIVTNSSTLTKNLRRIRNCGIDPHNKLLTVQTLGLNYHLTEFQAALINDQLDHLPNTLNKRRLLGKNLAASITKIPGLAVIETDPENLHSYNYFTLRVLPGFPLSRDQLVDKLNALGIGARIYYRRPLHLHPYFQKIAPKKVKLPIAVQAARQVLSLPLHPFLKSADISYMISCLTKLSV